MAQGGNNPFTNTRLMVAGIICGVIAAILAWVYINHRIQAETGGTAYVYYMSDDLAMDEPLEDHHVQSVRMPGVYADSASKHAMRAGERDDLNVILGRKPVRRMYKNEPISLYDFPYSTDEVSRPAIPPGKTVAVLPVESDYSPGGLLRVGDIVSVTANVNFGEGNRPSARDIRTLPLLEAVKVVSINDSQQSRQVEKIRKLSVLVSRETDLLLKRLTRRVEEYYVELLPENTVASNSREEIPPNVRSVIVEKLGPPDELR